MTPEEKAVATIANQLNNFGIQVFEQGLDSDVFNHLEDIGSQFVRIANAHLIEQIEALESKVSYQEFQLLKGREPDAHELVHGLGEDL